MLISISECFWIKLRNIFTLNQIIEKTRWHRLRLKLTLKFRLLKVYLKRCCVLKTACYVILMEKINCFYNCPQFCHLYPVYLANLSHFLGEGQMKSIERDLNPKFACLHCRKRRETTTLSFFCREKNFFFLYSLFVDFLRQQI